MSIPYRRIALDKLASPEELDHLPQLISPRLLFLLFFIFLLVFAVLIWGFIGRIPVTVKAQGIIQLKGDVTIESDSSGTVENVFVAVGDEVKPGQLVAVIRQDDQLSSLLEAQESLKNKQDEYARKKLHEQDRLEATSKKNAINKAYYETQLEDKINEIEWLREKRDNQKELYEKGLDTKANYVSADNDLKAGLNDIKDIKANIRQIDLDELTTQNDSNESLKSMVLDIQELSLKVSNLRRKLKHNLNVISPYEGKVLEVSARIGRQITTGQTIIRLATVDEIDQGLVIKLYISPNDGAKVQPGMQAIVTPFSIDYGVYGDLVGFVSDISNSAVSSDYMNMELKNDLLVQNMTANGAPYEASAYFLPDPESLNGLKWTTRKGAPLTIESGTLCSAKIITEQKRPVDFIMPFVQDKVLGQKKPDWLTDTSD
ncbi:NHLP bacteriocin system secretion protein [Desulfogranum japonicum]|uniref:NHLP bacteriocin system secretion protein n=1 Tax=Desulfogranum japonicum TaxID=231447 RepID=UPI00040D6961|nr:NHLP bacteriocin system secretion protein [Desulfogranum japonicum]